MGLLHERQVVELHKKMLNMNNLYAFCPSSSPQFERRLNAFEEEITITKEIKSNQSNIKPETHSITVPAIQCT